MYIDTLPSVPRYPLDPRERCAGVWGAGGRDAVEGKGSQRRFQKRLGRRLEEVAQAVGGGYRRLQMPLKPALAVRGTVAGHRLGALEGGYLPPFQFIPGGGGGGAGHKWVRSTQAIGV